MTPFLLSPGHGGGYGMQVNASGTRGPRKVAARTEPFATSPGAAGLSSVSPRD